MASERRLIDVNDFMAKLKERHENIMQDPEVSKHMKWCEAVHYGATTEIIEKMPTIEATPVVHGRWEKCWQEKSRHYFRCSNCQMAYMDGVSGAIAPEYGSRAWRYCPNCGAKMDGGVSDG